jgi:insertion element IS1 protein InsB
MSDTTPSRPPVPLCPRCGSASATRAGLTHNGVPSFRCPDCRRRYVAAPRKGRVTDDRKHLVLRLLGERMSLRAIARVTGLSRSWLQAFANDLSQSRTPWEPGPLQKKRAG